MTVMIAQIIFLVVSIALATIILLQQAKSGGMGSSFGGASSTVFGARGAGSFLYKATRFLAIVFFISALGLGYLQNKSLTHQTILNQTELETQKIEATVDVPQTSADNTQPASRTDIPNAAVAQ